LNVIQQLLPDLQEKEDVSGQKHQQQDTLDEKQMNVKNEISQQKDLLKREVKSIINIK